MSEPKLYIQRRVFRTMLALHPEPPVAMMRQPSEASATRHAAIARYRQAAMMAPRLTPALVG